MTATERLRELLDGRVVRWKRVRGHKDNGTSWHDVYGSYVEAVQEYAWDGGEFPEDKMVVRRGPAYMTPEQAIAATLGKEPDDTAMLKLHDRMNAALLEYERALGSEKADGAITVPFVAEMHQLLEEAATLGDADATRERQGDAGTCKDVAIEGEWFECSECGTVKQLIHPNYCPNCGRRCVG